MLIHERFIRVEAKHWPMEIRFGVLFKVGNWSASALPEILLEKGREQD